MKPIRNRNLYNGDCNVYFYNYKGNAWQRRSRGKLGATAVHGYVDLLADSGVDTFLFNPNGQRAWYPSKAVPTAWAGYKRGDKRFFYGHILGQPLTHERAEAYLAGMVSMMDRYLDLVEAGVDWVAETAKACRRRKVAPWLSIRMNDMHGANSFDGSFMNAPLLAQKEFRLNGRGYNLKEPPIPLREGLNFEKREVRDYMLAMMRELVESYDFEGLELDWTRSPLCCNVGASRKTVDLITRWHGEIRALTARRARQKGRPFFLGIRAPANFAHLRTVGLDVQAMARAGIIDFVCPTRGGWATTWDIDYEQMRRELGDDVALYGVVEDAPNWLPAYAAKADKRLLMRYLSASPAMLRGNAAGKLVLGADGIETFNFFCTDTPEHTQALGIKADYAALRGLADADALRGKPKFYAFSVGGDPWVVQNILEVPEHLPAYLEPQGQRLLRLPMMREPRGGTLTVQIVIEKRDDPPPLGVSFNSGVANFESVPTDRLLEPTGALTHHVKEYTAFNFKFPASEIRKGWNELIVVNGRKSEFTPETRRAGTVRVASVELLVQPRKP